MNLSPIALLTKGALMAHLAPKLRAGCGPINLGMALDGVTADNFAQRKASIVSEVLACTKNRLASDVDVSALKALLDALEDRPEGRTARDEDSEKARRLEELCSDYIATGKVETLEAICTLIGIEPDDALAAMPAPGAEGDRDERIALLKRLRDGIGTSALDRARTAMDSAEEKCRRLTGSRMSIDQRHAWKQRHLSRDERRALAMDESEGDGIFDKLFGPQVDSGRSPSPPAGSFEAIRAETLAMLDRIKAA